ncbi:MAG: sulfur transferase domain-containing protein [Gammaproteobacteria bacterium]|jgi:uncharacterized protein (TIGR01244 family)|nr:sulfur transferase domain-containing protein [Gammaproteobacteria bacterium]MDP6536536.1 sulfur transferase domain-containing protein [Gammaproteobacteria bacterium]MDP6733085.1 sulfur transferase domain-containing protein [Gammaproteobacteria bacterium]HAJ75358.1 hypothetical protein [Gammaproteobacteria bacterium]|tara:strand:+ start:515 stop:1054 length:540 start_codon:yes stop_codon:yes gene_type:complete
MNKINSLRHLIGTLSLLLLASCASTPTLDLDAVRAAEIFNLRAPQGNVLSSGQPTEDQLQAVGNAGVRHVINLRTAREEVDFEEKAAVEALGMQYYSIPVGGAAGVTQENAQSLQQLLDSLGNDPVLVHCASGNRVGGLFAINAFANGSSLEAAMAEGARWGMASEGLTRAVRETLSGN